MSPVSVCLFSISGSIRYEDIRKKTQPKRRTKFALHSWPIRIGPCPKKPKMLETKNPMEPIRLQMDIHQEICR